MNKTGWFNPVPGGLGMLFAAQFEIDFDRDVGLQFAPEQGFLFATNSGSRLSARLTAAVRCLKTTTIQKKAASRAGLSGRDTGTT